MSQYLLRRLLIAIPSLLGISVILFTVLALAPGDPFEELASNPAIPPDVRAARSEGDAADDLDQPDDGAARASSAPETLAEQGAMRPATRKETP